MKKILALIALLVATSVFGAGEEKTVCVDKIGKDGKTMRKADGTVVQDCKKIKVHKKLEGTEIPVKK